MDIGTILLVLTIITPPDAPDIVRKMREPSIEKCWEDAKAFIEQGVPRNVSGGLGIAAACAVTETRAKHS